MCAELAQMDEHITMLATTDECTNMYASCTKASYRTREGHFRFNKASFQILNIQTVDFAM